MYQKFWKQFLTEQSDATYKFVPDSEQLAAEVPAPPALPTLPPDEPVRQEPGQLKGVRAFIDELGFHYDKFLGGGADGRVYRALDKKTGQAVAIKTIDTRNTSQETARREIENYGFVMKNRNSFGENGKYLPVVYKAEMGAIPFSGQTIEGRKYAAGFIIMEELKPLPSEVSKALFAVGGRTPAVKAAREKRDKRLFRNPEFVSGLLNIAWSLTDPASTSAFMSMEAQFAAEPRILEKFFSGKGDVPVSDFSKDPYVRNAAMGERAKELMSLYINVTYEEMLKNPEEGESLDIIRDYEKTIKEDLLMSFSQAYNKPLVTGAAGKRLKHGSGLRGFDDFYNMQQKLEDEFPEIVGVRKAMKAFADRDFKPFDVHEANVMMRPRTNDIVIVDLGRFNM
jgi:hypothetical protein